MSITLEEINTIRRAFRPEELPRAPKGTTDTKQSECIPLRLAQASMESLESKKAEVSLYSKERFWQSILDYAETEMRIIDAISKVLSMRKASNVQIIYQKSLASLEVKIKALLKKIQTSPLTQKEEDSLIAQVGRYRRIEALLFSNQPIVNTEKSPLQQQAEQRWSDCIITTKRTLDEIHKSSTSAMPMNNHGKPDTINQSSRAICRTILQQLPPPKKTPGELHLGVKNFLKSWHVKLRYLEEELKKNKELLVSKAAIRCEYIDLIRNYIDLATFTHSETSISHSQGIQNRLDGLNTELRGLATSITALEKQVQDCASELELLHDFFEQEEQDWRLV
ncbi:MAG: hypothetical protein KGZ39_01745 [Simkania sp.]|nr:hypothetical protein [Simkania sp.]